MGNNASIFEEFSSLSVHDLACRRGGRLVFEGLSFELKAGDFLHLKGANGSGKTTLLRLLAGFLVPKKGEVRLAGNVLGPSEIPETRAFIYSGHQHGLKPVLTLRENSSAYYQLMTGHHLPDETLYNAADQFGLSSLVDLPVRFFSSGQTHRCSLLRFALLDRPVWLMDEPTVGLDSENRQRLNDLMSLHLNRGGMIIAASHDPLDITGKMIEMVDFAPKTKEEDLWL